MTTRITIDGYAYPMISRLGFNHDIGDYVYEVKTENGPKIAIGSKRTGYRFWNAQDRLSRFQVPRR